MKSIREEEEVGYYNLIFVCETCGWWNAEAGDTVDFRDGTALMREAHVVGSLRAPRFPITRSRPFVMDRNRKHPRYATAASAAAFERLAGEVFKVFDEVHHIGRSGDGNC
ncbi:MAG: hypothetical protein U0R19_24620 [Bryobacteraceae bacterium]